MKARYLSESLRQSPKSVLLLGPRQTGKTTLMQSLKPDLSINLADEAEYLTFLKNPSELKERLLLSNPKLVLIDEIQRRPELLNTLQTILDDKKNKTKFLMTGSSARKLKRGSANLLPGRIFSYRMGALSLLDLEFDINSVKALEIGCLPEPYLMSQQNHAEKLLRSYVGVYLKEEILAETLIRDLAGFSNFLTTVAENSGKILDLSKLANKSKVSRGAARRYFEILEDTLICEKLGNYRFPDDPEQDKRMVKHDKFYLFDVGVRNALLENFKASEDRKGLLFEHLFYNQIQNMAYSRDHNFNCYFFRTLAGQEIDFIFKIKKENVAVELKTSEPNPSEIKAFSRLAHSFGFKKKYIAILKGSAKKVHDVTIMPWQLILKELHQQSQ